jgi:hypothetical protein
VKYLQHFPRDFGVSTITRPPATVSYGDTIIPQAIVFASESTAFETIPAILEIDTFYRCSLSIALGGSTRLLTVDFDPWYVHEVGVDTVRCTLKVDDDSAQNNCKQSTVNVPTGWKEMTAAQMPVGGGKPIKDGGWLDFNSGNGLVYAAKGYKTNEFYAYDPAMNEWTPPYPDGLEVIPPGTEGRPPNKGCRGVCDGDSFVYMTKGNNTVGFWRYNIERDCWKQMKDVPLGSTGKKVKGGTDLAFVHGPPDYAYLLKGYRNEFYRFNVQGDSWEILESMPVGLSHNWKSGSWLVFDGDSVIYAHQAYYHGFYAYNVDSASWDSSLTGIPYYGREGRKKEEVQGWWLRSMARRLHPRAEGREHPGVLEVLAGNRHLD